MNHYEIRKYLGWNHHMLISMLSHFFLCRVAVKPLLTKGNPLVPEVMKSAPSGLEEGQFRGYLNGAFDHKKKISYKDNQHANLQHSDYKAVWMS